MYRFYYNEKSLGDILFIVINADKKSDHSLKRGQVVAIYSGDELIGYNIFSFHNIASLNNVGMIPSPSKDLLKAINEALTKEGFASLPTLEKTLYTIAEIVSMEEHPLDEKANIVTLSLGNEKKVTTVSHYINLKVGEKVVVEEDGCLTLDGSAFHSFIARNINNDVSICGANELLLTNGKKGEAYIPNTGIAGDDFFLGGK